MSKLAQANKWARRLKPVAAARSAASPAGLARTRRAYRELGLRKLPFTSVRHAEVAGSGGRLPRLDRPEGLAELESDPAFAGLDAEAQEQLRAWPERGYLVLERFFEPALVDAVNAQVDELLGGGDLHFHARSPRVMNAWRKSEAVAELAADERLHLIMRMILGREARLFQTINFIVGSQQSAHSDAFHMMTEPPGFLVGAWVALEDIDSEQGPVFYLPGSHRLPYVMSEELGLSGGGGLMVPDKGPTYVQRMRKIVAESDIEPVEFTAGRGDLLLWHHNLLHGGRKIRREGATRRSLVGHYFAEDVLCYHEVTERPALLPAGVP